LFDTIFFLLKLDVHSLYFFFNDPATTEIYTLSLHDALPISALRRDRGGRHRRGVRDVRADAADQAADGRCELAMALEEYKRKRKDRKSTRLNSSHVAISYAVFCLKKKKKKHNRTKYARRVRC